MNRTDFLKALGVGAASTAMIGELAIEGMTSEGGVEKVVVKDPAKAKIAVDLEAISHIGLSHGGKEMTAKEVFEIYNQTGVLLFRRTDRMSPDYQPIIVIQP